MAEVILIVGKPGSGKTYLANTRYVPKGYILIDDPIFDLEIRLFLSKNINLVITDPWLCLEKNRESAIKFFNQYNYNINWIFFENNDEKCFKNLVHRDDGRKIKNLDVFNYTIPEGIKPLEIWQPDI